VKIYTRSGDEGKTALFGGRRVGKDSARIEAYGTVDELNAFLGYACSRAENDEIRSHLTDIQHELFLLGSDLATPIDSKNVNVTRIDESNVQRLEALIDALEAQLQPIRYFILPGGTETASRLHVCRTVSRRTERCIVQLSTIEEINELDIKYINRLSDLLFVLARYANHIAGQQDVRWKQD